MPASTIPNSGGPGSSIELSPVTIAVRDKVIEKFADQPLDDMNESVKQLLSREEDEQKRLGILAARVYILRQRISKIAEGDVERVVGSAAPKAGDLMAGDGNVAGGDSGATEWTRLRILDDCEVNGVRFPKTVIIDVKTEDAKKLIASGSAELVEEDSVSSATATGEETADTAAVDAPDTVPDDADDAASVAETAEEADDAAEDTVDDRDDGDDGDDLSALSAVLDQAPAPQMDVEEPPQPADEAQGKGNQDATSEAVIDTPSAAEVTAALEALSTGDNDSEPAPAEAAAPEKVPAEDKADDAADVAAELEMLGATLAADGEITQDTANLEETASEAADVAAELEAAAAVMAAGPSNPDTSDLPLAGGEEDSENADKPAGWFEAQQNAEAAKRDEDKSDDEDS